MEKKYAVVKAVNEKRFTKWHGTYDEAHDEAERLCRVQKNSTFYVMKVIALCYIEEQPIPIKWELSDNDGPKDNQDS